MTTKDFTSTLLVAQPASAVFNAITNFRAWWSEDIEGKTDQLNETFFYHYKDVHLCKLKLVEMVAGKRLVYEVTENEFNFVKDNSEWVGTKLIFDISSAGDKTQLVFTHAGLVPHYECYPVCHDAWTSYIQGSLHSLITTGVGKPNAKEGGLNDELVKKWGLPDKKGTAETVKQAKDFTTSIEVDQSPEEVFKAINNVKGWWQGEITGSADQLNDEFTYHMGDVHFSKQRVVELIPYKKVVWLVTDSKINFVADKTEWTNTRIVFEINTVGNKTKLSFTHQGLVPAIECYGGCSRGWGQLIEKSLYSLITTGKGVDVF